LNAPGLTQFNARDVITKYFGIFSSDRHIKILQERENGNLIGAAFDELIRHHPSLKDAIMTATLGALVDIRVKGAAFRSEDDGYNLRVVPSVPSVQADSSSSTIAIDVPTPAAAPLVVNTLAEKVEEPKENEVLACLDVIGRVSQIYLLWLAQVRFWTN
jgi:E3 ubiquitin-protein ligase HUWE1